MRYFAYGSNLLTRRLTDPLRAPSAVARGIATVSGCVMRFHKIGTDGSGKCTLIGTGDDADVVYGVLYEFAATDLAGLDREEGVHLGGYARCPVRVRFPRWRRHRSHHLHRRRPLPRCNLGPLRLVPGCGGGGGHRARAAARVHPGVGADSGGTRPGRGAGEPGAEAIGEPPSYSARRALTMGTGSFRICPWTISLAAGASVGRRWISSSTSMPSTTRPKVA